MRSVGPLRPHIVRAPTGACSANGHITKTHRSSRFAQCQAQPAQCQARPARCSHHATRHGSPPDTAIRRPGCHLFRASPGRGPAARRVDAPVERPENKNLTINHGANGPLHRGEKTAPSDARADPRAPHSRPAPDAAGGGGEPGTLPHGQPPGSRGTPRACLRPNLSVVTAAR